jgi:hypothetical protein
LEEEDKANDVLVSLDFVARVLFCFPSFSPITFSADDDKDNELTLNSKYTAELTVGLLVITNMEIAKISVVSINVTASFGNDIGFRRLSDLFFSF